MCAPFLRLGIGYEYPDFSGFAETKHPVQRAINIGKMYGMFVMKRKLKFENLFYSWG